MLLFVYVDVVRRSVSTETFVHMIEIALAAPLRQTKKRENAEGVIFRMTPRSIRGVTSH